MRGAFTSAAGIVGAQIGGAIIAANGDVRRFGVLFGIAFVLDMISVALQGAMVEPALRVRTAQDEGGREARPSFFSDAKRLIRADKNLARYVAAMFLITIGMSFFNFQTAQSKDALGLTGGQLGIVTTILYVSQTAGNLLWGWFADRQGYRPSLLIGQAGFVLYLVLAFLARDALVDLHHDGHLRPGQRGQRPGVAQHGLPPLPPMRSGWGIIVSSTWR